MKTKEFAPKEQMTNSELCDGLYELWAVIKDSAEWVFGNETADGHYLQVLSETMEKLRANEEN